MAMLAEPRRKQRWSLNPNGRAWTDDGSKIGQKMLEKMGWSKGNGLGKSQNGMTDPIKVKANSNQTGLGFAGVCDTVWVQHQDDFNSLLSKLSQSAEAETPAKEAEDEPKSLEVMSKASTKRIHYHKFTKSKDLKKATAQDLASIFGAFPGSGPKAKPCENGGDESSNDAPEPSEKSTDKKAPNFGVVTIHGGCLNEYFNRKRAAKSGVEGEVVSVKVESGEVDEKEVESENVSNGEEIATVIDPAAEEVEQAPKKKSKKKLAEEKPSSSQQDVPVVKIKEENVSDAEDVPPVEAAEPPKKKSKRKAREVATEDVPDVETIRKEVKVENLAEGELLPSVKTEAEPLELPKKKVKKEKTSVPVEEVRREEPEDVKLLSEVPSKQKKKKKKEVDCSVKVESEVKKENLAASEIPSVVEESCSKKKKKRKIVDEVEKEEVSEPRKKKKIKAEISEDDKKGNEVVLLDSVQPEPQVDGKLKKKQKKSEGNAQVPHEKAFSVAPLIRRSAQQIVAYELINKKKSKKPPQEQLDSTAANFLGANLHEVNGYPNKKKKKAVKVKEEAA